MFQFYPFDFGAEPVGSVAPKINIADKGNIAAVYLNDDISIVCPAQAFPIAAFRYLISGQLDFTNTLFN